MIKSFKFRGERVGPGKMGDIVVKLPLPPGTFPTLWEQTKDIKKIICLLIQVTTKLTMLDILMKTVTYGSCQN